MPGSFVGIDVSKKTLSCWFAGSHSEVANSRKAFLKYLSKLPPGSKVAIENTGSYHLAAAEAAHASGFEVYVLNPRDCARCRQCSKPRAKTDKIDAEEIARFAEFAQGRLRRFFPLPAPVRRLRELLRRRSALSQARSLLEQSFAHSPDLAERLKPILDAMRELESELAAEMVREASGTESAGLLRRIPGFGPIVSSALAGVLEGGSFASSDSLVAYFGLDCRACDSGQKKGRRRISKQGDRLLRKLVYLAAMAARRTPEWAAYYEKMLAKGLTKVQSIVALARKLLRAAWSIAKRKADYDPARILPKPLT